MIRAVRCDSPTFKNVEFQPGFNVVLAERTLESTKKDSRNGLGKTTLIRIIHFCLGASVRKNIGLMHPRLQGWTFSLEIDIDGKTCVVSRGTADPRRVRIEADTSDWPIKPDLDLTGSATMSVRDWASVLGTLLFGLPLSLREESYVPTFRSLISYFTRLGRDAYTVPFEHFRKQKVGDKQVNNAFLLGLAWEDAQHWQKLRDQEAVLKQLKNAASAGVMPQFVGSIGELEALRIRLQEQSMREERQLASFQVHPEYRLVEQQANQLTARIHELVNDNVSDGRMLSFYESSYAAERPASSERVERMYAEAGVALPENVLKRLEDVRSFHERVVANRRSFLRAEIERLRTRILERESEVAALTNSRAQLLTVLRSHGALEEYTRLQQGHSQTVAQLEEVKTRLANVKRLEQGKRALHIERDQLQLKALADYEERHEIRQRAISLFNSNSEALYNAPGRLLIDIRSTGFEFGVEIERSDSQGIEQMKVFCYDLMLAQIWAERGLGPRFLVHDSTLFDGVDERQVALAMRLAAETSVEYGFQYICCLNSDSVPWRELVDFDVRGHLRMELTDATEDGGLLGIRF